MRLIDADAELKEAKELSGPQTGDGWDNWGVYALIERQPTIDAEPVKHGHWYDEPNYLGTSMTMYFCSECGSASYREDPYCWHCGSKMDVPDMDVGKMEVKE